MAKVTYSTALLRERMRTLGVTVADLARACSLSVWAMGERLRGHYEFKVSEVIAISQILHIPDEEVPAYFFREKFGKS